MFEQEIKMISAEYVDKGYQNSIFYLPILIAKFTDDKQITPFCLMMEIKIIRKFWMIDLKGHP